jgi:hypothetical protein
LTTIPHCVLPHLLLLGCLQDCLRKHPEVLEDLQSDKAGSSSSLRLS